MNNNLNSLIINSELSENLLNYNNDLMIKKLNSIDDFKIINPNIEDTINIEDTDNENNNMINLFDICIDVNMESNKIYTLILDEIYNNITDNNKLFENKDIVISKPDIKYENRKTYWLNYKKNCYQINRTLQQLQKFFEKELKVQTSINVNSQLILRGKYKFDLVSSIFKKYIKNYIQCITCKSFKTEIIRNSSNRLDYLKCLNNKCNNCTAVSKI